MTRLDKVPAHIIERALTTCVVWACCALATPAATAAPIVAGGGFDYLEGAGGQRTRSALAILGAPLGTNVNATLAGIRYDDAIVGPGSGVLAGLALGVTSDARLRMWGTQYFGDEDFRAWRVKAGPEATLPTGGTFGVFYAHDENNLGDVTNAGIAELGLPLVASVTGRASGSYAASRAGTASIFGSLGLGWAPVRNIEITGDIGRATNGIFGNSTGPRNGLPILGGGEAPSNSESSSEIPAGTVLQCGIRLLFP